MAELDQAHESYELGMHTEQLSGRTQQVFFSAEESDNLVYPWAPEVDFDKSGEKLFFISPLKSSGFSLNHTFTGALKPSFFLSSRFLGRRPSKVFLKSPLDSPLCRFTF